MAKSPGQKTSSQAVERTMAKKIAGKPAKRTSKTPARKKAKKKSVPPARKARKPVAAVTAVDNLAVPPPPLKICYERIIPEELDREQHARRAMRQMAIAAQGKPLNAAAAAAIARMAVVNSKKWEAGRILRCRFLDG